MKICIYGAGSVGCYIGGRLQAAGSDVCYIGRERIGKEMRQHGLQLSSYRNERWQVPPTAIHFSSEAIAAAAADLILVTVKSAATPTAAAELAGILKPSAIVISFQNGLGNSDVLRASLPQHTVLEGMVPFNVIAYGPGALHQGSQGELEVKTSPGLQAFIQDFSNAGLPLIQHADMLPVQWAKLLFNLNNAINALSNRPLKEELSQRVYRHCLALAQAEALALLAQAGMQPAKLTPLPATWIPAFLRLPDALFERLGSKMLAIDPLARSSMSDDLAAGRITEIDWINGEVVRLAERLGQQAPVNAHLCKLIRAAEQSAQRPSWSGDDLLTELADAKRRGGATH
ncbi:2-dehydropantoate 2-reductase [Dyella tabacisoli]|uniref:2-dehydropantoate 2-reductase n=1 Tax=Dyella tabacisoli TaxID=2282381 RepID=UPI001CDB5349|nr:2-dehydropantoate 2-reductase [Dyella tabacisoli]